MKYYKELKEELTKKVRGEFGYKKSDYIEETDLEPCPKIDLELLQSQIELLKCFNNFTHTHTYSCPCLILRDAGSAVIGYT